MDRFGRVVIPKPIRDDLGLEPGCVVRIEERDGEVRVVPVKEGEGLVVKEGVLVYGGVARGNIEGALAEVRKARIEHLSRGNRR